MGNSHEMKKKFKIEKKKIAEQRFAELSNKCFAHTQQNYAGDSCVYYVTLSDVVGASFRFSSVFNSDIEFFLFSQFSRNMRATDAHSFTFEHGLVHSSRRNRNVRAIGFGGGARAHSSKTCSAMLGAATTTRATKHSWTHCLPSRILYARLSSWFLFCFRLHTTFDAISQLADRPFQQHSYAHLVWKAATNGASLTEGGVLMANVATPSCYKWILVGKRAR